LILNPHDAISQKTALFMGEVSLIRFYELLIEILREVLVWTVRPCSVCKPHCNGILPWNADRQTDNRALFKSRCPPTGFSHSGLASPCFLNSPRLQSTSRSMQQQFIMEQKQLNPIC
jgi:hypothetical protein